MTGSDSNEIKATEIQKTILELEQGLRTLQKMADAIDVPRFGIVPQRAIVSFQTALRGLRGWELGELKNAFGLGSEKDKNKGMLKQDAGG